MIRMLCKSARNLSTRMYMLADDLGLIDAESIYSNEMKRVCRKMGCIADSGTLGLGNVRRPPVDIVETDEAIIATLELPGVEKEDIEITSVDDDLSVQAKRSAEPERDESVQRHERSYDLFKRSVKLPCGVKSEQAKAAFNNGLLTITLPKENATIRNRISIE
jgi:HSP20 family protein